MPNLFRAPFFAGLVFALAACMHAEPVQHAQVIPNETSIVFEASDAQTTEAFQGHLVVPENRNQPDSRLIRVEYVRFPATGKKPGSPIVYLSGGPGGSGIGTAKGRRFPLFMAMREFGDVIALDQRGTGASNDLPTCRSSQFDPDATPLSDADYVLRHKLAAEECLAFWKAEEVNIYGYTTQESVADLEALRTHLGADAISLWGISYGSHLSLAALKYMDDRIDRVVLASVEGLDQTVKYPARTDAYFDRLQAVIDADADLAMRYPDIKHLMRRVFAKLDAEPVLLSVPLREGSSAPFLFERRDLQTLTSGMISDPQWAILALGIFEELDAGGVAGITGLMSRFLDPGAPISYRPMSFAMDIASGVRAARKAEIVQQAQTALLKDYLNFPMPQLESVVDGLDLGDAFREPPVSDVPVLVLSGTLDGRTYPESQREAVAGLQKVHIVTIEDAGHNLFMSSPEVTKVIQSFMRGDTVGVTRIKVDIPAPDFD